MDLAEFDYDLPEAAIAQQPQRDRDGSRLLLMDRGSGTVRHRVFRDLPDLLDEGDLIVVNRSRVLPARLLGVRSGGGAAEVLLVRKLDDSAWEALVRPGRRLGPGTELKVGDDLSVRVESEALTPDGRRRIRLLTAGISPDQALVRHGHVPLPPYIHRPDRPEDRERYQTIFAREPGSVAAPTAGLHFSAELLECLRRRGVQRADVVLHVGPGTFQPVKAARVEDHRLAPEPYWIPSETADAVRLARARGRRVVAIGTTTTRALEASAQRHGQVVAEAGETDLVLVPGSPFRVVDALVTNFHLPRSSLLLLASAFAGKERLRAAYAEALSAGYRFYSYGDAMLIR